MLFDEMNLKSIPTSVKAGIGLLLAGWLSFLPSVWFFYSKDFFQKFFIAGLVTVFCISRLKDWARILALLSNTIIAIYCGFFAVIFYLGKGNPLAVVLSGCTLVLFVCSSIFLLKKDGVAFFKARTKTQENEPPAPAAPVPPTPAKKPTRK
jgi:hypothetical protein